MAKLTCLQTAGMKTNIIIDRIRSNFRKKSVAYRNKRFQDFIGIFAVKGGERIIDLGGAEDTWRGSGLEANVTLVNINFSIKDSLFRYIEADACQLDSIEDNSFDIVFSNSVIEHLGRRRRQKNSQHWSNA